MGLAGFWLFDATHHSHGIISMYFDWLMLPTTTNEVIGIKKHNLHKILIFSPQPLKKSLHRARIDELADSKQASNKDRKKNGGKTKEERWKMEWWKKEWNDKIKQPKFWQPMSITGWQYVNISTSCILGIFIFSWESLTSATILIQKI